MGEFELIWRYFAKDAGADPRVVLGIGDDCALLAPRAGFLTAFSTDMLVEGRHFYPDVDAQSLGHKALAVNLSDLAAMGATPLAFTLALAVPAVEPAWLHGFSSGLRATAEGFSCPLVGGDTTRGPRTISIAILGEVAADRAPRRSAAQPGHDIWISGRLGAAALAVRLIDGQAEATPAEREAALRALNWPTPQVALGQALGGLAAAMIDISDGLAGDLGHILERSGVGAEIWVDAVPAAAALATQDEATRLGCVLAGGDDYELCFTAPPERRGAILEVAGALGLEVGRVGQIVAGAGLLYLDARGRPYRFPDGLVLAGYEHFG